MNPSIPKKKTADLGGAPTPHPDLKSTEYHTITTEMIPKNAPPTTGGAPAAKPPRPEDLGPDWDTDAWDHRD